VVSASAASGQAFLSEWARGLVSQRAKGPISQREDPAAGSPAFPRPEFIRVHVTPPPGSAKRCMRRPRISYSNNKFGATEGESSGFAASATAGLVDLAIGCAHIRLGNWIGAMPMNPEALRRVTRF